MSKSSLKDVLDQLDQLVGFKQCNFRSDCQSQSNCDA